MKKTLLAAVISLLAAASAQAISYSDNNPADVWLNALNPSYTGTFTLAGYNPAAETITSATAEFTFADPFQGTESLKIDMGGDILTHGAFSGTLLLGESVVNALAVLDSTGVLSYTVSRTSSGALTEFWLTNAKLSAESAARDVPDAGSTSILLGLGVICVFVAKRRSVSGAK